MVFFVTWWLATSILGLLALPLAFFTFRHLPDRGYAASRVLGLLLVGYLAWLFGYALPAGPAVTVAAALVLGASAYFGRGHWATHMRFLKARLGYVLLVELLFFATLAIATQYKAATGAIHETEKPADFTILNALMTARQMPPHDPWLSGAPISYYYFGYFLVALVAKLTGTPAGVAFNMGLALVWALTALMGFALGYALTGRRRYGLLLAFALAFMGNLDYWFRAVHVYHYGDLREKYLLLPDNPQIAPGASGVVQYLFNPLGHLWEYYHASRIIDATPSERLITEFPAFSFFLGDLHPHVMSLPFFLATLCLSLNFLKAPLSGWGVFGSRRPWQVVQFLIAGIAYGSLGFLNSWDLPTVMLVLAACLALRQMWASGGLSVAWFVSFASVGLPLAALAIVAYLPFYRDLQTQLQGIEIVKDRTDLRYWPVLFGAFLVVLVPALVARARGARETTSAPKSEAPARSEREARKKERPRKPARRASEERRDPGTPSRPCCVLCGAAGAERTVCDVCGGEIVSPQASAELPDARVGSALGALGRALAPRGTAGWAMLGMLTALALVDLIWSEFDPAVTLLSIVLALLALATLGVRGESRELAFASVLALFGFGILTLCEWLYFKDLFSMYPHLARMNTVFKFYVHAWVLLAAASIPLLAWLLRTVWPRWPKPARIAWASLAVLVAIAGLWYPFLAFRTRLWANPAPYGDLDGSNHFRTRAPEDARAVEWLTANATFEGGKPPVVLEAWGVSFTPFGRIATYTGFTTVLGWEGHEEQWRGGPEKPIRGGVDAVDTVRRRYLDADVLYLSPSVEETRRLLRRYGVGYVYVGATERTKFPGAPFGKWSALGERVYADGPVEIYKVHR